MGKIRDNSTPDEDAKLPKREAKRPSSFGDKEIGSGGTRTRADGVQVNGRSIDDDKGWTTSR